METEREREGGGGRHIGCLRKEGNILLRISKVKTAKQVRGNGNT